MRPCKTPCVRIRTNQFRSDILLQRFVKSTFHDVYRGPRIYNAIGHVCPQSPQSTLQHLAMTISQPYFANEAAKNGHVAGKS